jgi:hypothetical protein
VAESITWGGTLEFKNSTLSGNSAFNNGNGGGIVNDASHGDATLSITNSTLSGNSAGTSGGGVWNKGESGSATLTIQNSTLSGNSAGSNGGGVGGGIVNDGSFGGTATLTIRKSTLSGNSVPSFNQGGGIYNSGGFDGGVATLEIGGTILKTGASGENIFNVGGTVISEGYNLSSDAAGGDGTTSPGGLLNAPGDIRNTDPLLGPLQNNGGPTFTHLPASNSPVVDAGPPEFDQRGPDFNRVVNSRMDIGAVEVQATLTPVPAAPTATGATNVTSSSFIANWNTVSGAAGYRMDVAKNSSFGGGTFVTGYHNLNVGNVASRFVGGLNANTTYYYRVRAFNSSGVSPNSNVITVTTSP